MNDNDRAALVAALQETIREAFGYGTVPMEYNSGQMAESFVEQHIDRLLAERHGETTVPDDRVERVERAIWDALESGRPYEWFKEGNIEKYRVAAFNQDDLTAMARAAIAAAGPEAHPDLTAAYMAGVAKGEDWLDAALDTPWELVEKVRSALHHFRADANREGASEAHVRIGAEYAAAIIATVKLSIRRNAIATALAAKQEGDAR